MGRRLMMAHLSGPDLPSGTYGHGDTSSEGDELIALRLFVQSHGGDADLTAALTVDHIYVYQGAQVCWCD